MLIKLYVDDNFPIEVPGGPQMVMWIVSENLAINHPKQGEALLKSLKLGQDKLADIAFDQLFFVNQGNYIDPAQTFTEAGIKNGGMLRITTVPPPMSPKASMMGRQPSQFSEGGSPGSPMQRGMSMYGGAGGGEFEEEQDMDGATRMQMGGTTTSSGSEDELYEAQDCGWFPFSYVTNDYGESAVSFPNPDVEPQENDHLPNTHQLCGTCAETISNLDTLCIPCDRHYKPMLMKTDIVEGMVEKVGGTRIPRWQNRYLTISEKSMDWYEKEPKPGTKDKMKGTRAMWDNNNLLLQEVLENPDGNKYPKVKDKTEKFHFGAIFIGSSKQQVHMIFRCNTLQEKNKFVGFMQGILKRAANKGATRDPVHWKRWANNFLINLADVGELSAANDEEEEALLAEIKHLEAELADLKDEKPKLQAELDDQTAKVNLQSQELLSLQSDMKDLQKKSKEAEEKVQRALQDYVDTEAAMAEEMKLTRMLEQRAAKRKTESQDELEALLAEVASLRGYQNQLFGQWRKGEENHKQEKANSTERHFSFSLDGSVLSEGEAYSQSRAQAREDWRSPSLQTQAFHRSSSVRSGGSNQSGGNGPTSPGSPGPRNPQRRLQY